MAEQIRGEEDTRILEELLEESKKGKAYNVTAIVVPSEPPPIFKISAEGSIGNTEPQSQIPRMIDPRWPNMHAAYLQGRLGQGLTGIQ